MRKRSLLLTWLAIALVVTAVLAAGAGFAGRGPFAGLGTTETELEPINVRIDHRAIYLYRIEIGAIWPDGGSCGGALSVTATETPTEVRVGPVISRTGHGGACELGRRPDGLVWAILQMTGPLANRVVVRASDGVPLPIYTEPPRPLP